MSRKRGFYEKYIKRLFDIICALLAIICFSWLYIIVAILVRIKLGSPIIFKQPRPGLINSKTGKEKIFYMYKFRTMTDKKDADGKLLSDEERLTSFGKKLRATSLDELPEALILRIFPASPVVAPAPVIATPKTAVGAPAIVAVPPLPTTIAPPAAMVAAPIAVPPLPTSDILSPSAINALSVVRNAAL